MAAVWFLYFMVAVERKFLWSLFREMRHATSKLQALLGEHPQCVADARRVISAQIPKHCKGK